MRNRALLVVFIAALPLAAWASGTVDFQSARGEVGVKSLPTAPWSGFTPSSIRNGSSFDQVRLGFLIADNRSFDGSQRKGPWVKVMPISLHEEEHNVRHEHSKGGDDHRGDDGGKVALPVPEPGTLSLFGAGLVGLAGIIRRRRNS